MRRTNQRQCMEFLCFLAPFMLLMAALVLWCAEE